MRFSFNFLQSFFVKKLPSVEKIAELLNLHSFEVKSIEKKDNDFVLDIDVPPNRASDSFSHIGIAREIGAILNIKISFPEINFKEEKKFKIKDFVKVFVKNPEACLRYNGALVFNVKVEDSPSWLAKRLVSCGVRPINNIVDISNYVMLELGQPLHAFDFDKIAGTGPKKIIVRNAKSKEKIVCLDNEEYELEKDTLVIADQKAPLAIAGIKGGKKAEITKSTKKVFLESANFSPFRIRKTSSLIDLKTDASLRFEHGLDPNLTEIAIKRALFLIQKLAGGKIISGILDYYPKKVYPWKIFLPFKKIEKLLGTKIPITKIIKILENLELKIISEKKDGILVEVPTFRKDLILPQDLIEEIGRIFGYEKIAPKSPISLLSLPEKNLPNYWEEMAKNILKELGFNEVYNYSFISERDKEIFEIKNIIEVENPTSSEFKYLRPSLIPNLLKNLKENRKYFEKIKIFELGKVFLLEEKKKKIKEKKRLTGLLNGDLFFEAKGIVESLIHKMGIAKVWYDSFKAFPVNTIHSIWHPGKTAQIKVNQEIIGFLGELSPNFLNNLNIKEKVIIFDLDFEKLSTLASEEMSYQPVSQFPALVRDISILVPIYTRVDEVLNVIEISGGELLVNVELFDIFEGENLPEGKKSLSFRLVFQAKDRVLTSREVEAIFQKIIKDIETNVDWEVRK